MELSLLFSHLSFQTPHLVNLNEDATLSECLLYYIKEGVTRIGSPEANIPQDIQLVGAHILSEHCVFENSEGIVKLVPLVSGADSVKHSTGGVALGLTLRLGLFRSFNLAAQFFLPDCTAAFVSRV